MKHILIAAKTGEACKILSGHIDSALYEVSTATDGMTVRGIDISRFGVIVISVPLENESGLELLTELRERTAAHLIAIVREEAAEAARKRLSAVGAYVVTKPIARGSLMQAVRFLDTHCANETALRERVAELEQKAALERMLFRAELIVMDKEKLDEDGAYRRIQKLAMDLRATLYDTAEDIVNGLLV